MHEKNPTTLRGVLMCPLAVGKRAVVFSQGRFIRTSPISAIYSRNANAVKFATWDTEYTLLLDPLAQSARKASALAA